MAIVEPNEVVVLILVLVGYPFVILNYSRYKSTLYLFLGYTALVVGSMLTIIEGFYYKETRDIINFFEHLIGILLAGFFFSLSAYFTMKKSSTIEYEIERKLRGKSKK